MKEVKETIDVEATVVEEVSLKPVEQSKTPFTIAWNFEELKGKLETNLKNYVGLVVTAENLQSMSKTHREIVTLRTGLEKFRKAVKSEAEKPIKEFEGQVKELAGLIAKVETPIKEQIEKYDTQRKEIKSAAVQKIIDGLIGEYHLTTLSDQLVILDKHLTKGADELDVLADLRAKAQELQKEEMEMELHESFMFELCARISLDHGLNTPILATKEIVSATYGKEESFATDYILRLARERLDIENKAKATATQAAAPEGVNMEPPKPAPGTAKQTGQTIAMRFIGMSREQAQALKNVLVEQKINYEVIK